MRTFLVLCCSLLLHSTVTLRHSAVLQRHHRQAQALTRASSASADDGFVVSKPPEGMEQVLFIETGVGSDQHGQDATKACVKACKDAISFNSIPSIGQIVPGGRPNMKLRVQLAVPFVEDGQGTLVAPPNLDLEAVADVFPYGTVLQPIEVQNGGMLAASGAAVRRLGDKDDAWVIAIAAITIGY